MKGQRSRAAAVSIVSNTALIVLKLVAGLVTGSVAIITEAIHSSVDLAASYIAFVSVRKAEKPADATTATGTRKFEYLAAAARGVLILVGAGVIVFESVRRLSNGAEVHSLGIGIAVIAFSGVLANVVVSTRGSRVPRAGNRLAGRSKATPRTCAPMPRRRPPCSSGLSSCRSRAPRGLTR